MLLEESSYKLDELDNGSHKKFKYFKYITTEQDIVNYLIKQDLSFISVIGLSKTLEKLLKKMILIGLKL